MINYFELEFLRVTAHRIEAKTEDSPTSEAIPGTELIDLDPDTEYKIKEKLFDASDKKTKSFDLKVGDKGGTSFWGIASPLDKASDATFISETGRLSLLLAGAQTTAAIRPSYLITIHARSADTGRYAFIAIKADMNEAFVFRDGAIHPIDDLFLSPEQKLFKFGIIYKLEPWEKEELGLTENTEEPLHESLTEWGAFLFDNQFSVDSKPAAYFWREFLGFSLEDNAKIQTKRFYDASEKFAEANIQDFDKRREFIQMLDIEMTATDEEDFSPQVYGNDIDLEEGVKEAYDQQVTRHMPVRIVKDISLISNKINRKKIAFPGNVQLSAPSGAFDTSIELITTPEQLSSISTQQESYTIVKILGRPFTNKAIEDEESDGFVKKVNKAVQEYADEHGYEVTTNINV